MKKIGIFIIGFLIIFAIFFLVLGFLDNGKSANSKNFNPEDSKNYNAENIINNYQGIAGDIVKDIKEKSSSEGGGGGGGSEPTSTTQDFTQTQGQISYSIKNFEQNSFCNQYQGIDCIDKTSDCLLLVENLDNQVIGIFEINFIFSDTLNQELFSNSISHSISPGNNQTFASSFNIQGQDANQDISCSYATLTIPKKII